MPRDGIANLLIELGMRGFKPRRLEHNVWEARCPGHRSLDHALSITRNEFNHVVLECRSEHRCPHMRIVSALGWTNDHLYAETPAWMISRVRQMGFQSGEAENLKGKPDGDVPKIATSTPREDFSDEVAVPPLAVLALPAPQVAPVERPIARSLALAMVEPPSRAAPGDREADAGAQQSLLRLASIARFFRALDGRFFAGVPVGSRHEIHSLRSTAFRDWLIDGYYATCREIPSEGSVRRVLVALEAQARYSGEIPAIFVRTGYEGSAPGDPAQHPRLDGHRPQWMAAGLR
jgi:hypothetical protein